MINDKNEIKSGDGSTNIQGKAVTVNQNNGMNYSEVRQIAMDVFKSNFYELGDKVEPIIYQRAEEIISKYLERLQIESPESLSNTEDPDVRYAIYNVQKNHVRRGDSHIADLMVEALVERTKIDNQDFLKLIINESLEVIPKLTMKQIDILTIIFILRYVNIKEIFTLSNLPDIIRFFTEDIPKNEWIYQHLQFTGCISISIGSVDLAKILTEAYEEQLPVGGEIKDYLMSIGSDLINVIEAWENSNLENSSLTSVGIAIALSNFKRKTEVAWDLDAWISDL